MSQIESDAVLLAYCDCAVRGAGLDVLGGRPVKSLLGVMEAAGHVQVIAQSPAPLLSSDVLLGTALGVVVVRITPAGISRYAALCAVRSLGAWLRGTPRHQRTNARG